MHRTKLLGWHRKLLRCLRPLILLAVSFSLGGCNLDPFGTRQEVQEVRTHTREDVNTVRGDVLRLQEEVNNLAARFDRLSSAHEREIVALKSSINRLESQAGQYAPSILSEVDRKLDELDTKRVADKNELASKINSVIDRVNTLSGKMRAPSPGPAGSEAVSQKGFYYTVEDGDTLWGIAAKFRNEYGVTVDAIRQANNISSSDHRIVTGQKLFIPVKQ